jgi:hypothetical protein
MFHPQRRNRDSISPAEVANDRVESPCRGPGANRPECLDIFRFMQNLIPIRFCTILFAVLATLSPLHATPPDDAVPAGFSAQPGVLHWQPVRQAEEWSLRIAAPTGETVGFTSRGAAPVLTLHDLADRLGEVPDGSYTWELSASLDVDAGTGRALREARDRGIAAPPWVLEAGRELRRSGSFRVIHGSFHYDPDAVDPVTLEEESGEAGVSMELAEGFDALRGTAVPGPLNDRQTFDTTDPNFPGPANGFGVRNSLCVGAGCQTAEDYGADTIRMRESTLRIAFDDSSTSGGSFPFQDWQILANDQTSGGLNRFSVYDQTADTVPFTVEGDAPGDALYVDDQGRVGVGTAAPDQRLHLRHGSAPGIVFEQDTTQSFAARIWELAGDDEEFFLRDVTNSSARPVRIAAGAPEDAMVLTGGGALGLGTGTPDHALHVLKSDGTAAVKIEETSFSASKRILLRLKSNGKVSATFANTADNTTWSLDNLTRGFAISLSGTNVNELLVTPSGSLEVLDDALVGDRLGVGTATPAAPLHLTRSDGTAQALVEELSATTANRNLLELKNNGPVTMVLRRTDGGDSWTVKALDGGFSIGRSGDSSNQFQVSADGNVTVTNGAGTALMSLDGSGNLTLLGSLTQNGSPLRYEAPRTAAHREDEGSADRVVALETELAALRAEMAALRAEMERMGAGR